MLKRKWKYVLAAVLAPLAWLIFFSIDFEYNKKTDLGGGMTLISTIHVDRSPYWGMADSGGSFYIPFIPSSNSQMIRQKVIRNHAVVWEMNEEIRPEILLRCGESRQSLPACQTISRKLPVANPRSRHGTVP
jgi:hypothetical protein